MKKSLLRVGFIETDTLRYENFEEQIEIIQKDDDLFYVSFLSDDTLKEERFQTLCKQDIYEIVSTLLKEK
jgi:hypothetical protein